MIRNIEYNKNLTNRGLFVIFITIFLFSLWVVIDRNSLPLEAAAESVPYAMSEYNAAIIGTSTVVSPTVYLPVITRPIVQGKGILFVSDRAAYEKYDLYSMNADGSNVKRLTNLGIDSYWSFQHEFMPRWSPDGTKVAAQIDGELYIMNADGSDLQPLLVNPDIKAQGIPEWSPDGSYLAFELFLCNQPRPNCNNGSAGGIRTLNFTTMKYELIISSGYEQRTDIQWSADAQKLYVISDSGGYLIGHLNGTPTDHVSGLGVVEAFEVAANDQKIAYVSGFDVYVANIDGTNIVTVYDWNPASSSAIAFDVVWRPDSQKLAFALANVSQVTHSIFVSNPDGSGRVELTDYDRQSRKRLLGWTADGSRFIYSSDVGQTTWAEDIYIVNEDGSNPVNLTINTPNDDSPADYLEVN